MPHLIDGKRRQRIARGSGTSVEEVNRLLEARKMMEKMLKQMGKGKMPSLPGMEGIGDAVGAPAAPQAQSPQAKRAAERRKKNKRKASRR